jgi:hypothetical protein
MFLSRIDMLVLMRSTPTHEIIDLMKNTFPLVLLGGILMLVPPTKAEVQTNDDLGAVASKELPPIDRRVLETVFVSRVVPRREVRFLVPLGTSGGAQARRLVRSEIVYL